MNDNQLVKFPAAGDAAPRFEFVGRNGVVYNSTEILQAGPILLTFYRGAWCSCCQADLRDLMRTMPELRSAGLTVLGVFHQLSFEANIRISGEYGLDFPLVDDVGGRVAEAFGVRRSAREIEEIESELGPELLALQQGQPWIMPMQARFLIRADGLIARSEIIWNYNERSDAHGLLPLLRSSN